MQTVDHIIHAKWVITCEEKNRILENHSIVIKDRKIAAILPTKDAKTLYASKQEESFANHIITPGFFNSHTHLSMSLFRGLADDLPLMDWLKKYIWPAETKWVSETFVHEGALLAMAEMIRCGTICFNDMYFFSEAVAKAADQVKMRGAVAMTIIDVPTAYAKTPEDYFEKGIALYEAFKDHPLVKPTLAPHSSYAVSLPYLEKIRDFAHQFHLKTNIHLQEDPAEIRLSDETYHMRPLERLNALGMVNPDLIAIHMTQLNNTDFELLAQKKPSIVHCPESNMKLASGACAVDKLLHLGINVALGTDGAASNNDLDMISEMRSAALLGKLSSNNPAALPVETVLKMATIHGAKALGIDHITGSLEVGKSADFIAIKIDEIETQPLYHPLSQIIYASNRNNVTDVWVEGRPLMRNRKLLTLDEQELFKIASKWRQRIEKIENHEESYG